MPRDILTIISEVVSLNPVLPPLAAEHLVKIKQPTDKFHIRSFLHNARTWRGFAARRIKAELREYLK
jgi:hypothetical protein